MGAELPSNLRAAFLTDEGSSSHIHLDGSKEAKEQGRS